MNKDIYTIGYAGKSLNEFLKCLKKFNIHYLIDIRTSPRSKTFPDYDKDCLSSFLLKNKIRYVFLGKEFGARRKEDNVYEYTFSIKGQDREQVIFNNVYKLDTFKECVSAVMNVIASGYNICFMCSEKEPVDCHRFWMVAYFFEKVLNVGFKSINIIDFNKTKSFDEVVADLKFDQTKNAFLKEHEFEIEGYGLFGFKKRLWISWWADFYLNKRINEIEKIHLFANYLIGYIKGEEEYD